MCTGLLEVDLGVKAFFALQRPNNAVKNSNAVITAFLAIVVTVGNKESPRIYAMEVVEEYQQAMCVPFRSYTRASPRKGTFLLRASILLKPLSTKDLHYFDE